MPAEAYRDFWDKKVKKPPFFKFLDLVLARSSRMLFTFFRPEHRGQSFFFKLTADQVLVSNWIAGSSQAKTRLHFSRAQLRLDAASTSSSKHVYGRRYSCFRWKTVWKKTSFSCIFGGFNRKQVGHYYEGPLRTKYRMCIYQCYAAYMNAMCNISTSKHVRYKLKVSDKTKRCFIKDEEAEMISQNRKWCHYVPRLLAKQGLSLNTKWRLLELQLGLQIQKGFSWN